MHGQGLAHLSHPQRDRPACFPHLKMRTLGSRSQARWPGAPQDGIILLDGFTLSQVTQHYWLAAPQGPAAATSHPGSSAMSVRPWGPHLSCPRRHLGTRCCGDRLLHPRPGCAWGEQPGQTQRPSAGLLQPPLRASPLRAKVLVPLDVTPGERVTPGTGSLPLLQPCRPRTWALARDAALLFSWALHPWLLWPVATLPVSRQCPIVVRRPAGPSVAGAHRTEPRGHSHLPGAPGGPLLLIPRLAESRSLARWPSLKTVPVSGQPRSWLCTPRRATVAPSSWAPLRTPLCLHLHF